MKKLLLIALLAASYSNFAQKTVIIKKSENISKSIDGDGKEIIITKTMENDDLADSMDDMTKNGDYLTVEKKIINGKEESLYKLTKVKDGKKEVIAWDGAGEMPPAIKEKMKNVNVNTNTDGMMKTITIESSGDEDKPRKGKRKKVDQGRNTRDKNWSWTSDKGESRSGREERTQLGIMLNDNGEGVHVDEVFKGSVADKAGINKGDVLLKINGDYIFSSGQLMKKIRLFNSGDKADITILRDKKETNLKAQF